MHRVQAVLLMIILLAVNFTSALEINAESGDTLSIEDVLGKIRMSQEVETNEEINAGSVSRRQLQQLGKLVISLTDESELYREIIGSVMSGGDYDTLEEIYELTGLRYLRHIETKSGISKDIESRFDYHVGYGEILILLSLIVIVLLVRIYEIVRKKAGQ